MYGTRYSILNKNKKVIYDASKHGNTKCFSAYANFYPVNYGRWGNNNTIETFINKRYDPKVFNFGNSDGGEDNTYGAAEMVFTADQIKFHLNNLQSIFPTTLKEEEDQYIVIVKESDYLSKSHVRAALDFIRILWEKDLNQTLVEYFKLSAEQIIDLDYFVIIQAIYIWVNVNAQRKYHIDHYLPCGGYYVTKGCILTREEFLTASKEAKNKEQGSTQLWNEVVQQKKIIVSEDSSWLRSVEKIDLKDVDAIKQIIKLINE